MADVDRISELPESLLHHVLSFLPQKQAIQTSALSKTWRHVGPSRPKIELRQTHFEWCGGGRGGKHKLISVLADTIQTYHRRKFSLNEFIFEISPETVRQSVLDCRSTSALDEHLPTLLLDFGVQRLDFSAPHYFLSPSLVFRAESLVDLRLGGVNFATSRDHGQPLFKSLQRLSLDKVRLDDSTLESIIRTCPLIQHLSISCRVGSATKILNLTAFPAESSLEELHLSGLGLLQLTATSGPTEHPLPIKRLKTLALEKVVVSDETLDAIVASCPSIERVLLSNCVGPTKVNLDGLSKIRTVEIRAGGNTLLNWYHYNKHFFFFFFPRLKSLILDSVGLSEDFFESFSSVFPSLEHLELNCCYGFSEIRLTACSVERLAITDDKPERLTITIYAPSIRLFDLSVLSPPQLNFYTEGQTEWESKVVMLDRDWSSEDKGSIFPWLVHLRELLASLSESEISLDVSSDPFEDLRANESNDPSFCEPVTIEQVRVRGESGGRVSSLFPCIVNCLFLVCRPRYICMKWYKEEGKNMLVEYIVFQIVGNRGGRNRGFFWERDVEEISMEVWDDKSRRWNTAPVEWKRITGPSDLEIRFPVKWLD